MTKTLVRLTAVLVFALCTSACSTIDDLIGGDDAPATTPTADSNGFPPDAAPPAQTADNGGNPLAAGTGPTATTADNGGTAPVAPAADSGTAPDLAAIPEKPSGTTTPDDQREVADSLAADRGRATYSSDALRGGTEAAAPPPGPAPEPGATVADNAPPPADTTSPPPDNTPPPSDRTPPSGGAMPAVAGAPAVDNTPPSAAPTTNVASASVPTYTRPPGSQPAVPANGAVPGSQPMATSDAALGFRPSTAPALDSSISQFVAQPIIARYQQTASNGGVATGPIAPLDGGSSNAAVPATRMGRGRAVGGPEAMTGSVVANFDALNGASASTPSVYANAGGLPPTAVVMFPGDGTALSAAGRAQVRMAVTAFQQRGGTGFIKVIGHSSSRTSNMPVEKHLVAIFAKSQARANAVAAEIIREGVPASRVLVEAVGDSQPVYYESMPQGEDGNRRAEIFVQG